MGQPPGARGRWSPIVRDWTDRGDDRGQGGERCPCDECKPSPGRFRRRWYPTTLTQVLRQPASWALIAQRHDHQGRRLRPIIDPDTFRRFASAPRPPARWQPQRRRPVTACWAAWCGKCGSMMRSGFGATPPTASGHRSSPARPRPRAGAAPWPYSTTTPSRGTGSPVRLPLLARVRRRPRTSAGRSILGRPRRHRRRPPGGTPAWSSRATCCGRRPRRDTYKRQQQRITERIAAVESALATVSPAAPVAALDADDPRERWGVMTFTERRTVLEAVLDRVIVSPAEKRGGPFRARAAGRAFQVGGLRPLRPAPFDPWRSSTNDCSPPSRTSPAPHRPAPTCALDVGRRRD